MRSTCVCRAGFTMPHSNGLSRSCLRRGSYFFAVCLRAANAGSLPRHHREQTVRHRTARPRFDPVSLRTSRLLAAYDGDGRHRPHLSGTRRPRRRPILDVVARCGRTHIRIFPALWFDCRSISATRKWEDDGRGLRGPQACGAEADSQSILHRRQNSFPSWRTI